MNAVCFVGIAGPSCAGKGELSRLLARELRAPVVELDAYYFPLDHLSAEERAAKNFDDPSSIDQALLTSHMQQLLRGETIERPVYDFTRHTRAASSVTVRPNPVILVEGLFTLYWENVRRMLSAAIFITASDAVCLERRVARDQAERGRSAECATRQYQATVQPMRALYVDPSQRHAGLVLDGTAPVRTNADAALRMLRESLPATAGLRASVFPES